MSENQGGKVVSSFLKRIFGSLRHDLYVPYGGKDMVARYSHGNVKLQTGQYLTLEDSAAMKRRVHKYEF